MVAATIAKEKIKRDLAELLSREKEVQRVIVFGSFVTSDTPHDLDVAVFQSSDEAYWPLAMKNRRLTRDIARQIPMDILPYRIGVPGGWFLREEVLRGEVIYERRP